MINILRFCFKDDDQFYQSIILLQVHPSYCGQYLQKYIQIIIKILFSLQNIGSETMGNSASNEEDQTFSTKITFIEKVSDQNLGSLHIFRFKEPPYEYLMDHQKLFVEGDLRSWQKYAQNMKKLRSIEHKNVAKIHFVDAKQQINLCIRGTNVHTYCSYYNFTLKNAIDKKKSRQFRFSESEIIYLFSCIIDFAKELQKHNVSFGQYQADNIYLSPEGYIKIYLLTVDPENKHRSYHKGIIERQKIDQLVLAPQQLYYMYQLEPQPRIDVHKADVFAIALIAMQVMTLQDLKFYYNSEKNGLKIDRIHFDLNSLSSQYSLPLLDLLKNCLQENPNYRMSLQEVSIALEDIKRSASNASYCILLSNTEEIKKKQPIIIRSNHILSGIEKRLSPKPIETLSQSTSSGMQSKGSFYRNEEVKR